VRLGFGHNVNVTNLAVPTSVALSGAGATGGSTTYGYRVAAVNAKGHDDRQRRGHDDDRPGVPELRFADHDLVASSIGRV